MKRNRQAFVTMVFIFFVSFFMVVPNQTFAHTSLAHAVPAPDSQLDTSPSEIILTFSDRLEDRMYEVRLLDQEGKEILSEHAVTISSDRKLLTLQAPSLHDGVYSVHYQVVSSDGHTLRDSFRFSVGEGDTNLAEANNPSPVYTDALVYFVRAIYVISLLLLIGWIFWGRFIRNDSETFLKFRHFTVLLLQIIHLLFLLVMILLQTAGLAAGKGDPIMIPIGAGFGFSWLVMLILAFVGFFVLLRSVRLDFVWIIGLVVAKSFNGHAAAMDPIWFAVLLGGVHVAAAAVWGGGLFFILFSWKKFHLFIAELLPIFSKASFTSMFFLWISGGLTAMLYMSDFYELFTTPWGRLLLLKFLFVLCVTVVASVLRFRIRKGEHANTLRQWIAVDFGFMAVIAGIAGVLTYMTTG